MASVSRLPGKTERLQRDDQVIRVFILSKSGMIRSGLSAILGESSEVLVVGSSAESDAIHRPQKLNPDVLLLDMTSGTPIPAAWLGLVAHAKLIWLTRNDYGGPASALPAAHEILTERSKVEDLLRCIRTVSRSPGGANVSDASSATAPRPAPPRLLSQREMRVITLLALGYTVKHIAAEFRISSRTVETYRARAVKKLRLKDRSEIVRHAMRQGWLTRLTT